MAVVIETTIGDLIIDLYCDERPNCCKNFLKLCKMKYYNFCLFHNVQKNYIAQTGDPIGTGRGGESIYGLAYGDQAKYFDKEFIPKIKHKKFGCVSMINNGDGKHGSQFLITLDVNLDYLNDKHSVFGEVSKGFDILDKFNECITDKDGRPYQDIRICHTVVLDDPFEDLRGLDIPPCSPEPTDDRLESDRIRVDEDIDILEGKTEEEVQKILEERETQKRAKVLEIIGDIPDADVKPPENVLFVCKLNPVTSDEDLEMIFSRFGPIKSCEVIRDHKTKESLCYAFIEFENESDCEDAFFKMNNVLIDDRRIHVDFSQSVSKIIWKGKGTGTGQGYHEHYANKINDDKKKYDVNKYEIKNKSRSRHGYDLVFDEENTKNNSQNTRYENERNYKHNRSTERSERHRHRDEKYDKYDKYDDRKNGSPRRHHKNDRNSERTRSRERDSKRYDRKSSRNH